MAKEKKVVSTGLDSLPYGPEDVDLELAKARETSIPIPEGITRKRMVEDVLMITWPSLFELILTQLTSMADQIMVGRISGEAGVAGLSAIGIAAQPKFMLMTIMIAMNVGSTAVIARYRGRQDRKTVNQALAQCVFINAVMGVIFMAAGILFARPLTEFMGGANLSASTLDLAVEYLDIQMYGFVPLVLTFTITGALRGIGDSRTPLIYNTIANVVNLVFNYLMIYGKFGFPAMGVRGAAWATNIGQMVAFFMALWMIIGEKRYMHLIFKGFRLDKGLLMDVVRIGIPSIVEQVFMRAGLIIYTRAVSGLGDVMYAAHNVCMSIMSISFMMGQAFANASTTLFGQSLGKRRIDIAKLYMHQTRILGLMTSVIVAALIYLFRANLVGIYNETPEIIAAGSGILVLIALIQPIQTSQFVVSGGLRGAGDTKYTAMVMAITVLGVRSLLAVLLINVFHLGLWGAWIAMAADQCIRTVLIIYRYNTGKWAQIRLSDAANDS